jgi:hypothetical protein
MSKKLIISESEKNEIKNLYQLNEQTFLDALLDFDSISNNGDTTSGDTKTDNTKTDDTETSSNTNINASDTFDKVTDFVIKKFEGGYWNPYCKHKSIGGSSTETMFGLDRYNGNIERTDEGKKFFGIIDKEKKDRGAFRVGRKWYRMGEFCKKWTHGFKGGDKEAELRKLTISIMKKNYERNATAYFTPELKKRVEKSPGLTLHFSYATWNGPGFFQKFAKSMSEKLKNDPNMSESELIDSGIADRGKTGLYGKDKVSLAMRDKNLINNIS